MVLEAPSIRKREGGTVAGDCRHMLTRGNLACQSSCRACLRPGLGRVGQKDRKETPEEKLLLREKGRFLHKSPEGLCRGWKRIESRSTECSVKSSSLTGEGQVKKLERAVPPNT